MGRNHDGDDQHQGDDHTDGCDALRHQQGSERHPQQFFYQAASGKGQHPCEHQCQHQVQQGLTGEHAVDMLALCSVALAHTHLAGALHHG